MSFISIMLKLLNSAGTNFIRYCCILILCFRFKRRIKEAKKDPPRKNNIILTNIITNFVVVSLSKVNLKQKATIKKRKSEKKICKSIKNGFQNFFSNNLSLPQKRQTRDPKENKKDAPYKRPKKKLSMTTLL